MKKTAFFLAAIMLFSLFSCAKIEADYSETASEITKEENETMTENTNEKDTEPEDTRERTKTKDPHVVAAFSPEMLDKLYSDTKAYYGDLHVHSNSGGKSDGKTLLSDYTKGMDKLGVDFVALVDHKQIRHTVLPEFDNNRMLIGTEAANFFPEYPNKAESTGLSSIHYNMIFRNSDDFIKVMEKFPEFKFQGDKLTGYFPYYPHFNTKKMISLAQYINSLGGIFVYAHPTGTSLNCLDINKTFFGDNTYFEVLYSLDKSLVQKQYKVWVNHLNAGHRIYVSGGSDTHSAVKNDCVSVFYTKEKKNTAFFDTMKAGNYTVGCLGIQMAIGDAPMGGETKYEKGKLLNVRTGDVFENYDKSHKYCFRISTDRGVCFEVDDFDMTKPFECAVEIEDRMYYRAEVIDMTSKDPVALSNPIWITN